MADVKVRAVLTAQTTLNGIFTTSDGVPLANDDYVLAAGQASGVQNGIWVAKLGAPWVRPSEGMDYSKGFEVRVLEGNNNEMALWVQNNNGVPDASNTTFQKESLGRVYENAGGLSINGHQISIAPTGIEQGIYDVTTLTILADGRIEKAVSGNTETSYIDGMEFQYDSATSFIVQPGTAYIPGIDRVIRLGSQVVATKLGAAWDNTYVYLYETNGVGQIETSLTPPDVPFSAFARTKQGNNTRRYIGMVKNNSAGNLFPFLFEALSGGLYKFMYATPDTDVDKRVINAYTGTTTAQNLLVGTTSATAAHRMIAPGSLSGFVYWVTTGAGVKYLGNRPTADFDPSRVLAAASVGREWIEVGTSQMLTYRLATSTDTLTVYITGYMGRR